jgi:ABC-2 type transport system permease protein
MKLKSRIQAGISDSFNIWNQELHNIRKDIGVVIFFVIVPVVYPIIYGTIYNTEAIRNVPLVVVDESHSSLAREFIRIIDATPDVEVYATVSSMDEARLVVDRKEAYGILLIPSDFSRKIHTGQQSTVALYLDMSGLLFYKSILLATTEASMSGFTAHNVQYTFFNTDFSAPATQPSIPILYESVPFYNTQSGFASFLLPAILILVIQQTLLLGIGMLSATTRERYSGKLIPPKSMYCGAFRIVFGKALAYLSIYTFICVWALSIVPSIFNLPQLADYYTILLFALPYLLACIFFAMIIATVIRGRETPMMVLVFTSLIFLFLSGISWPASAISGFWKCISYLIPSTLGIQGFVKLNSMGATLQEVTFEYQILWLQTGVYFVIAYIIYGCNLKKGAR